MRFIETELSGVYLVELEKREDHRGFFARTWCRDEIAREGLDPTIAQMNTGFTLQKGTLRGMHFQRAPDAEVKFVRCTRGSVFDVAVDLRPESPTFKKWVGFELTAINERMLWIPEGLAHGYQTLEDETEILYTTSRPYAPDSASGVRWDDPAFGISWPMEVARISDADRNWSDFTR